VPDTTYNRFLNTLAQAAEEADSWVKPTKTWKRLNAAGVNKKVALLIAIMALFLALSEMLGKSANTEAITLNIKVSDTWNFFQAKNIRRTVVLAAAEEMKVGTTRVNDSDAKDAMTKQIDEWQKTAARYRSEPETREGTTELAARA
jgi:hypothetical protein